MPTKYKYFVHKNETYHITKNTDIAVDGKDARPADILKDKNAIVIFGKSDNDNLINLIYVLP
ncbi:hypothetical protein HY024_02380 [Candidatus Curtissbacteria bacterium]|nr:hypothetical protein [Candidatus Curtissbacteria bacterium]